MQGKICPTCCVIEISILEQGPLVRGLILIENDMVRDTDFAMYMMHFLIFNNVKSDFRDSGSD